MGIRLNNHLPQQIGLLQLLKTDNLTSAQDLNFSLKPSLPIGRLYDETDKQALCQICMTYLVSPFDNNLSIKFGHFQQKETLPLDVLRLLEKTWFTWSALNPLGSWSFWLGMRISQTVIFSRHCIFRLSVCTLCINNTLREIQQIWAQTSNRTQGWTD